MTEPSSIPEASRKARNDAIFRDANERIESCVDSMDGPVDDGPLPFLCECSDVTCTAIIRLTRAEYDALRGDPTRFATVPGHEGHESWARVVEETDRYAVVQKLGRAADVAIELDPRSAR
jgi:hypothetical protein